MEKIIHQGRNIKRIREMLGIKQDALAIEMGDDWNQKKISLLESKESIEPQILDEVAKAMKVPAEAIKNFDEEKAIYNISCNFSDNAVNTTTYNIQNINPLEKWLEALDENKKLYERLLKEKEIMIEELKKKI